MLIVACVVLGDLLHRAFNRIPASVWMIALFVVVGWVYFRFFTGRDWEGVIPVTVQDLLNAAKERKWMKKYDRGAAESSF